MAVVGILAVHLTGASRQQVFQGPKAVLDPMATLPRPDEPRPADGGFETHHVELLLAGLTDHDDRHRAIRRTGGPQPRIAHAGDLRAVTPGPIPLLQVVPLDLAPVWQCEDIGTFPFDEEGTLVRHSHVAHELRIAKPTIGDDERRGQRHTAPTKGCYAPIQHALYPVQFIAARSPRACGVRPTDGKVDGDDQLALADHDDQQHPVNAREHPVFLATPPGAHQAQLLAVLLEYRVIADPGPLPAAACSCTRVGGVTPQRYQHVCAQASEPLKPGALGQRTEHA